MCRAIATHNFKWLKVYVICEIEIPICISVSRLKVYFTVNSSLSEVIQVLIKTQNFELSLHQCSKGWKRLWSPLAHKALIFVIITIITASHLHRLLHLMHRLLRPEPSDNLDLSDLEHDEMTSQWPLASILSEDITPVPIRPQLRRDVDPMLD